jgi:hypothetical protein
LGRIPPESGAHGRKGRSNNRDRASTTSDFREALPSTSRSRASPDQLVSRSAKHEGFCKQVAAVPITLEWPDPVFSFWTPTPEAETSEATRFGIAALRAPGLCRTANHAELQSWGMNTQLEPTRNIHRRQMDRHSQEDGACSIRGRRSPGANFSHPKRPENGNSGIKVHTRIHQGWRLNSKGVGFSKRMFLPLFLLLFFGLNLSNYMLKLF